MGVSATLQLRRHDLPAENSRPSDPSRSGPESACDQYSLPTSSYAGQDPLRGPVVLQLDRPAPCRRTIEARGEGTFAPYYRRRRKVVAGPLAHDAGGLFKLSFSSRRLRAQPGRRRKRPARLSRLPLTQTGGFARCLLGTVQVGLFAAPVTASVAYAGNRRLAGDLEQIRYLPGCQEDHWVPPAPGSENHAPKKYVRAPGRHCFSWRHGARQRSRFLLSL